MAKHSTLGGGYEESFVNACKEVGIEGVQGYHQSVPDVGGFVLVITALFVLLMLVYTILSYLLDKLFQDRLQEIKNPYSIKGRKIR